MWASFDWVRPVDLEQTLKQQQLAELVDARRLVVKTAALEEAVDRWPGAVLRRAQSTHPALILASDDELSLSRATRCPRTEAVASRGGCAAKRQEEDEPTDDRRRSPPVAYRTIFPESRDQAKT